MNSDSVRAWCNRAHIQLARFVRVFVVVMMIMFVAAAVSFFLRKLHPGFIAIAAINAGLLGFSWLHLTRWIRMKTTVIGFGEHWQTWNQDIVNVDVMGVAEDEDGNEVVTFTHRRSGLVDEMKKWDFLITFRKVDHPLVGNP